MRFRPCVYYRPHGLTVENLNPIIYQTIITHTMLKNKQSERLNSLLIIYDGDTEHVGLSLLFENNGFSVTTSQQNLTPDAFDNFGAIAHIGRSKSLLDKRLAEQLEKIRDEEWILIAGDDENDLHCTVELTQKASHELRIFVRSLWSMFSMT